MENRPLQLLEDAIRNAPAAFEETLQSMIDVTVGPHTDDPARQPTVEDYVNVAVAVATVVVPEAAGARPAAAGRMAARGEGAAVRGRGPPPTPTGNLAERLGGQEVKTLVERVNRGLADINELTPRQRGIAAQFFEETAGNVRGRYAEEAAQLNLDRAAFLRGQTDRVPGGLPERIKR